MCRKSPQGMRTMNAAAAKERIDKMLTMESRGWGDQAHALERIAKRCKLPAGTIDNIRTGRTKGLLADVGDAIKLAYLEMLRTQIRRWKVELDRERKAGHVDDDLENMEREAEDLSSRLAARVERIRKRQQRARQ